MIWAAKNVSAERNFEKWGEPNIIFSFKEFESCSGEVFSRGGVFSILENSSIVDIYLRVNPGKPLVVFFNGAQNRSENYRFPSFSGLKVTPVENASLLCINDPSLYMGDDIKMGWYAGSKFLDLQGKIIPEVVSKIKDSISASRLIFVGGSSGGTASLYYSRLFPGSFCIASNPQTDILKYRKHHVNRYLRRCLGVKGIEAAKKSPEALNGVVTSILDYYSGTVLNHTIYLQNKHDSGHFQTHFSDFLRSLDLQVPEGFGSYQLNLKLLVYVGDWGKGHKSAPREFWANMLNNVVENEGHWDTLFKEKRASELFQ